MQSPIKTDRSSVFPLWCGTGVVASLAHTQSGKSRTAGGWLAGVASSFGVWQGECRGEMKVLPPASWAWSRSGRCMCSASVALDARIHQSHFSASAQAGRPGGILFLTSSVLLAVSSRKRGPRYLPARSLARHFLLDSTCPGCGTTRGNLPFLTLWEGPAVTERRLHHGRQRGWIRAGWCFIPQDGRSMNPPCTCSNSHTLVHAHLCTLCCDEPRRWHYIRVACFDALTVN